MGQRVMLGDFAKALGQLTDPRFRRVLLMGLGLTIALLAGATVLFGWVVGLFVPDVVTLPFFGEVSWLDSVASWATVLLMIVLSVVLMVPVAAAFTGIFLDDVAEAVEEKHYPGLTPVGTIPLMDTLRDSISLIVVTIGVNLVALILFFFVGPLAPVLFWVVNGYLLGREFFQLAAMRREGREGANALRSRHAGQIWVAGTLMAVPLSVPLVNLLIPILGAATFTHMYHRLAGR
ncbi:membrane protein [Sinisalibacter aestuarii]|uniref:Membrane protein n=2 Tax=Sinisalibacter aestuarii TaxID=2949426 RepID=A0ABQ5LR64_9RHOB|nr:membrane protein [Sinisalibacter aestuarii]